MYFTVPCRLVTRTQKRMSSSVITITPATGGEPDLRNVCKDESDRVTLRNIVYTLWATNKPLSSAPTNGGLADGGSCYMGFHVRRLEGKGYCISAYFGPGLCGVALFFMSSSLTDTNVIRDGSLCF